jgi:hypothetical protein
MARHLVSGASTTLPYTDHQQFINRLIQAFNHPLIVPNRAVIST